MLRNESSNTIWTGPDTISTTEMDIAIDEIVGQGLGYDEWKHALEAKGWAYNTDIENAVIRAEYEYFKSEIEQLLAGPKLTQDSSKSNCFARILKRIRGEELIEGAGAVDRLFGRDMDQLGSGGISGSAEQDRLLLWPSGFVAFAPSPGPAEGFDIELGSALPSTKNVETSGKLKKRPCVEIASYTAGKEKRPGLMMTLGTLHLPPSHDTMAHQLNTKTHFPCKIDECDRDFARLADMQRHVREVHGDLLHCTKSDCNWRRAKCKGRLEEHLLKAHLSTHKGELFHDDILYNHC
jgi:hypothetical protein